MVQAIRQVQVRVVQQVLEQVIQVLLEQVMELVIQREQVVQQANLMVQVHLLLTQLEQVQAKV